MVGDDGVGQYYSYGYDAAQDEYYSRQVDSTGKVTEQWANALGHMTRMDVNGETLYSVETILSDNSTDVRKLSEDNFAQRGPRLRSTGSPTGPTHSVSFIPPAKTRELVYIKTRLITDARGETSRYDYDQWQNIIKTTFADGGVETREYHPTYALPTRIVAEDGTVTEAEYDGAGNLIRFTEAKGKPEERVTTYGHDAHGNVTRVTVLGDADTQESTLRFTFDAYGNVLTLRDAEEHLT